LSEVKKISRILIYNSGGGLGDSIQIIPIILSLKNHFKDSLKEYDIKIETLELNLKYFGFRWWHLLFVKKNYFPSLSPSLHLVCTY